MRLPNTVVIGAPKSGTTSLFHYCRQHPQIFLPEKKELHYFSRVQLGERTQGPGDRNALAHICDSEADYRRQYARVGDEPVVMEVSPSYLYFAEVSQQIKETLGMVKIIALLRNPVLKAFSQYQHLRRVARETLTFEQALDSEDERLRMGWSDMWLYQTSSLYADRLDIYCRTFGRENVKIILAEEFFENPVAILNDMFGFLGIPCSEQLDVAQIHNRSGLPRSRLIARALIAQGPAKSMMRTLLPESIRTRLRERVMSANTGAKEALRPETRDRLHDFFSEDIAKVGALIGRSTNWRP